MPRFETKMISDCLQVVAKAAAKRSALEAIEGILVKGDGNTITMCATDLLLTIQAHIEVPHFEEFGIVLPGKSVSLISNLPGEHFDLLIDDAYVTNITSGKAKYKLQGLKADEFPETPKEEPVHVFSVHSTALKNALAKTLVCVSTDESRHHFCCINFVIDEAEGLVLNATDTYRLAKTTIPIEIKSITDAAKKNFLISGEILKQIAKVLPAGETVTVKIGEKHVVFSCNHLTLVTRMVDDENYPDLDRVIPADFSSSATVNTKEFSAAVERIMAVADKTPAINIKFDPQEAGNSLFDVTSHIGLGAADEKIEVDFDGEAIDLHLNSGFLADFLKVAAGDTVTMLFTGNINPVILKDSADPDYIYLALPVRVMNKS
ncbi:MAG: DNA polymerase III subunit beta [Dethiobacteraceae bacterium]|jgi:DNA polymerase-3 subunit beta